MVSSVGIVLLMICSISIVSSLNDPKCRRLSNGCKLKSYYCNEYQNKTKCHMFVCHQIDMSFQFEQTEIERIRNCSFNNPEVKEKEALHNVYFQLSKKSILGGSFDILNNNLFFTTVENEIDNSIIDSEVYMHDRLTFRYVKGFDIGKFNQRNSSIRMDFYYSNFDFYSNRSLIRSCEHIGNFTQFKYVFHSFFPSCNYCYNDFRFYNCEYKRIICPFYIAWSMAYKKKTYLTFDGIQNTFFKSNFPRFQPILNYSSFNVSNTKTYLFHSLELIHMQNIELNSLILNEFLFSNLRLLKLFGDIVSIEKGLFKSFRKLIHIHIDMLSFRKIMHREIDWIFDLNSGIDVNIYNKSLAYDTINSKNINCIGLYIYYPLYDQKIQSAILNYNDDFPDEDFCLYAKIPIQQLIFIDFIETTIKEKDISCIYLWSFRYQQILFDFCQKYGVLDLFIINYMLKTTKFDKCNFNKR